MRFYNTSRVFVVLIAVFAVLLIPAFGQAGSKAKSNDKQPSIRFVCVSALVENQKVILASRSEEGKWQEISDLELRSSLITEAIPAEFGELHLAVREGTGITSVCHFTCPTGSGNGLLVLVSDPNAKTYNARFVDPKEIKYEKGSLLIFNFSAKNNVMLLGTAEVKIEAGKQVVAKPILEDNGMYRLQVSYIGEDNTSQAYFDRYISGNPDSHEMFFLLPDETSVLKVFSLPVFTNFD